MVEVTRIIHISDLHFTDINPENGEPVHGEDSFEPTALPAFEGFAGHRLGALKALHSWNKKHGLEQGSMPEKQFLALTGDLTASGELNQFEAGIQFLEGGFVRTERDPGLGLLCTKDFWQRSAIPGNHDWFPWGATRNLVRSHARGARRTTALRIFRSTPYVESLELSSGCKIVLIGINTDSDIWMDTLTEFGDEMFILRLLARGHCISELHDLAGKLSKDKLLGREVRVLLLHHSIEYRSSLLSNLFEMKCLEFVEASAKLLKEFIKQNRIDVVLSGHIHRPTLAKFDLDGHICYEIRCGTTTQHLQLPDFWQQTGAWVAIAASRLTLSRSARRAYEHLWDQKRRRPVQRDRSNVLLDHHIRLTEGGSKLTWQTQAWAEHSGAFVKRNDLLPTDEPLVLWPA